MANLTFSGHDTFHCRHFWLKKGYDLTAQNKPFNDDAVLNLGVGRNMVTAIRYWLRAFDILNESDELNDLAKKIFDDKGWDPFLEDEGTLWLLHYQLAKKQHASIYNIIFSELRKFRPEFTLKHFLDFIDREKGEFNQNTLKKDFQVFQRTYLATKDEKDLEESLSGLLTELGLVREIKREKKSYLNIENKKRPELPYQIVLFAILDNEDYGNSISFRSFYNEKNGIGNIFALSEDGLFEKISQITENYKDITFVNEAGVRELQFKSNKPAAIKILEDYYAKN
ncbi:DUF4007 family protein [Fulvivirga ligni]|uniref:DUF4007 family protein n=1 Tax=Fulvivirga ligni TaxID=2904246 RepID=UPI001F3E5CF5|nr:DUF4007 family protein [Fulvivirga ligni]UII20847.1 DUF4007 family protein [Fulvivirga ligni]